MIPSPYSVPEIAHEEESSKETELMQKKESIMELSDLIQEHDPEVATASNLAIDFVPLELFIFLQSSLEPEKTR